MKVFVTGATGFIGKRLLCCLKDKGKNIKILSRQTHPEYETLVCDLQSDLIPDGALDGVDSVFHLAGFAHDLRDPSEVEHLYRTVNVDATVRLTELAASSGIKRFVFVSSVKAGTIHEDDLYGLPKGVYGETKREAELKTLEIGMQSEMHVSININLLSTRHYSPLPILATNYF